jgi:hypothetical protein
MVKQVNAKNTNDAKELDNTVKIIGNPDLWKLVSKVFSDEHQWMKSTKAMNIEGRGVLVQVSTQLGDQVAEALTFIPDAMVEGPFKDKVTGIESYRIFGTVKDD